MTDYNLILGTVFDDSQAQTEFDRVVKKLQRDANKEGKIKISTDFDEANQQRIIRATKQYKDSLGNVREEVYRYHAAQEKTEKMAAREAEFRLEAIRYTDDSVKSREKELKVIEQQVESAEKFLSKSKNMDLANKDVIAARNKAQEIINLAPQGDMLGPTASPEMIAKSTRELNILAEATKQVGQSTRSWSEGLRQALKHIVEYATGLQLIYGAMNQLKEGIGYVVELNKTMTDIQVIGAEGASTNEEIAQLVVNFNSLAKEMGVTTQAVAEGSREWLRQGKSVAETQELLKSTMMLSKLGALDSAQATEYLTSTLNGFNMEASEANRVVDTMISLDNNAATSAGITKFCPSV
jgi:hypothetical protein